MSDYTPGGMSDSEPSMEDILASIRKIIADDSSKPQAPTPGESALPSLSATDADSDFDDILDLADDEFSEFVSSDLNEDITAAKPDVEAAPYNMTGAADEADEDILDLTQSLLLADEAPAQDDTDFDADFDLVLGDEDSEETIAVKAGAAMAAAGGAAAVIGANADDKKADVSGEILTDIDALLDSDFDETEFDLDLDIPSEPEQVVDPAADLIAQDDDADDEDELEDLMSDLTTRADEPDAPDTASDAVLGAQEIVEPDTGRASGDADIDLVKSLMAELTEDEDGEFDIMTEESGVGDTQAAASAVESEGTEPAPADLGEIDSDDFDLEDLLSEVEDTPGDVTGIAASAPEQAEDALPVDDDLASIVAQSSADIEAAKTDAAALQGDEAGIGEFDIEALIDDVPQEDTSDNAEGGLLTAAVAGASVLGVGASALAGAGSDDEDMDDVAAEQDVSETNAAKTNASEAEAPETAASEDDLTDEEQGVLEEIEVAAESAHEFDDLKKLAEENPAALTDPTFEKDTDMPRIVKTDSIATPETVEAASGAFASLSQVVEEKAVYNESGPRIGDLVQEALKPMLQDWLDKNLKGIVDRAVAKEIKRISSGK